jgi:hypothetical protein
LGLNEKALQVHPVAVEKDAEFRRASDDALATLERLGADELVKRQKDFLGDCEERKSATKDTKSYDLDQLRESHGKAYASWTEGEEAELKLRFQAGETIGAIAVGLGRKAGGIRSRLKKLELI